MAFQKVFDISTCHIPNQYILNHVTPSIVVAEYLEGWYCWIPIKEEFYQYPLWLVNIFLLALSEHCHYIRFDADGEIYLELPKFDW